MTHLTPEAKWMLKTLDLWADDGDEDRRETARRKRNMRSHLRRVEEATAKRERKRLVDVVARRLHVWGRGPWCNRRNVTEEVCKGCTDYATHLLREDA